VGPADWRINATPIVAGRGSRRAALVGALLAGVVLALATYSAQQAWLNQRHEHRHGDGAAQVAAGAARRV
jgi:Na+/H+-translocating membrane pyrophosphatase